MLGIKLRLTTTTIIDRAIVKACRRTFNLLFSDIAPNRLETLLELALRTSAAQHDPYKDDVR